MMLTNTHFSFIEILKVICHANSVEIPFPPTLINFSSTGFDAFLKELIAKVSAKDEEVDLLIGDITFVDDAIRDTVKSIMASGEVSGPVSQRHAICGNHSNMLCSFHYCPILCTDS
jgi:hypothetical protein